MKYYTVNSLHSQVLISVITLFCIKLREHKIISAQSQGLIFCVLDLTLTLVCLNCLSWLQMCEYDYCNLINVNNSIHVVAVTLATTITPGNEQTIQTTHEGPIWKLQYYANNVSSQLKKSVKFDNIKEDLLLVNPSNNICINTARVLKLWYQKSWYFIS